ncbi:hypothetical protein WSK_1608 [Novosphingobium sp. Rr 2-17]|uniref:hypothetical protein n=1 Tax=Novosphingobium sp. Rr 2-17 TaxID=555793 RepID=UPI0002699B8A|nr:hypothetical protein [Novosphingobium sp. Rr 2-17]EIZ79800.1 hypothetical protein WSK_1608 [Novosphingobium sp. Rr 2-17]
MTIRSKMAATVAMLLAGSICSSAHAQAANSAPPPPAAPSAASAAWADAAKMPDLFTGMWMTFSGFVEGDKSLNVPFTPKAQKFVDAYKPKRDIPYAQEGCKSPGLTLAMRLGGGLKFTYAPGLMSIYMQSVGDARFIKMDQKQGTTAPKFYGNSVGHWEGDTLVVESKDFSSEIAFQYGVGQGLPPEETVGTVGLGPPPTALLASLSAAIWGPHGEDMHMVERMRLIDPETLRIQTTVYDDTVWTKPYVTTRDYKRIQKGKKVDGLPPDVDLSGEPEEWLCGLSITTFDPETNTYSDKDPEEMVKYLDKQQQ